MTEEFIIDQVVGKINSSVGPVSTLDLARDFDVDHQKIVGAIKSLVAQASATTDKYLNITPKEYKQLSLTPEGIIISKDGSHESRIFKAVLDSRPNGIDQESLLKCIPDASMAKIGFSKAMSNQWIQLDKETRLIHPKKEAINDEVQQLLASIAKMSLEDSRKVDSKTVADLKKRKLITETSIKYMIVEKGSEFSVKIERPETDMTTALIQSGEWRAKKFKDYNFDALGLPPDRGHLHPLMKVRDQFRQIFLEMGFSEMPTNNYVESSFWNFDTLVVPQAHPARDSQDTFFLRFPEKANRLEDRALVDRVSLAHRGTMDGKWPRGYRYEWSEDESSRNVLRTHTTAVTARMLYELANRHKLSGDSRFKPAKLFSIDRVFRNETLDATHLAEFNQVEGVVLDEDLTLGDLMGILEAFFEKLGIGRLRFKPAYNPYTEPSMEIFSFHSGLKKWVEVGNSGVFRPELMQALGLPETVTGIAWGLSLERPTMIKYKIENIRDMVGHKVNLEMVHENPLCLF